MLFFINYSTSFVFADATVYVFRCSKVVSKQLFGKEADVRKESNFDFVEFLPHLLNLHQTSILQCHHVVLSVSSAQVPHSTTISPLSRNNIERCLPHQFHHHHLESIHYLTLHHPQQSNHLNFPHHHHLLKLP